MEQPTDRLQIELQGNKYETQFTIGKVIDSERYKAFYTGGLYANIRNNFALDAVDVIAYLRAFFPKAEQALKLESLLDMPPSLYKEINDEMVKKFIPWYRAWTKLMQEAEKEKDKSEEESNEANE